MSEEADEYEQQASAEFVRGLAQKTRLQGQMEGCVVIMKYLLRYVTSEDEAVRAHTRMLKEIKQRWFSIHNFLFNEVNATHRAWEQKRQEEREKERQKELLAKKEDEYQYNDNNDYDYGENSTSETKNEEEEKGNTKEEEDDGYLSSNLFLTDDDEGYYYEKKSEDRSRRKKKSKQRQVLYSLCFYSLSWLLYSS